MASHKYEDLKKKCEGIKFDPMSQPRVGLNFFLIPDVSIIDKEASVKATMANKRNIYVVSKDFEIVVRKVIAKLFCNAYKYVIRICEKTDGVFLDPNFFSVTLNVYYAGGKINPLKFVKEFSKLANYNMEWRSLSKMVHAVVVESPDNADRPIMEEDGISIPEGFPEFETGGWCCWKNGSLKNTTGLVFADPEEKIKEATELSLFSNEIFGNAQNGMFKKLFEYNEKRIPGTNVSVSSNNIKKKNVVSLDDTEDSFDKGNISFVPPKKCDRNEIAYFNGSKPKNKKVPQEHQEILYGSKKKKLPTAEQIRQMNEEIEAYEQQSKEA